MSLAALAQGFRSAYLDHAELTAQLKAWHAAYPDLTRLTSLGTTPEGRELWLLTIGVDPDRVRPTAWVDGNMHASELAGSSVALAIAEDFLAAHVDPARLDLSPAVLARLREVRLFVLAAHVARRRGGGAHHRAVRALGAARRSRRARRQPSGAPATSTATACLW
jgi:hypothetical protein